MSYGSNDPRVFFSIDNIRAFHLQNGEESELTPSGPQTMTLLMVPTTSQVNDPNIPNTNTQTSEEDFYLHLHLPPELELPLPATTQLYHQPPDSYLIPRWELGPDAGAFTRIQFPPIGAGPGRVSQEDVDTFETILAQCTAFHERSAPPQYDNRYNPATFSQGEGYVGKGPEKAQEQKPQNTGQIVLIDEENGSVVGELTDGFNVVESSDVKHGSKNPVQIQLPSEGQGNDISVSNVSDEYLQTSRHPAYAKSSLVQSSATASRLLVTTSQYVAKGLQTGADSFTKKTKPTAQPMTFKDSTQAHIRRINTVSTSAAGLSAKTVGQVTRYAQNFGASLAGKNDKNRRPKGFDKDGKPIYDYKPGILNKSMIAFSTIADGIDQGARNLLQSGSDAATTMMAHRYGAEAGAVTSQLTGGAKNVGLVYIDAAGVSRKAVLKSVAKGMVVGRMKDGQQILVGGGDGGQLPPGVTGTPTGFGSPGANQNLASPGTLSPSSRRSTSPAPPPAYGSRSGTSLGGTPMQQGKR